MNSPIRVRDGSRAGGIALFALLPALAFAQVAATPAAAPAKPAPALAAAAPAEEVLVLSPFVVDSSRDVGFIAASALAGGRLATDLKDTPAAYTVLTREFIDAVGLTDVAKASAWTVNSSAATDDGRSTQFGNPGFSTLTNFRGVRADQPQINFFPAYFDYDSYNLDRFDFSRGPNSILFGSGSNGGTANALYKSARLDKAFRELQVKVGSWDYYRATIDVNQPLTKTLAVRGNFLWQDNHTWRDREFESKLAGSAHLTFQPWEKTRFQAIVEKGKVRNNFALTTLGDRLAGWDGTTTYSAPLAAAPANSTGTVRNGSSTAPYYVFSPGLLGDAVVNWANSAATQSGGQNTGTPIGGAQIVGASINNDQNPILDTNGLPANFLSRAISGSNFKLPGREFAPTYDGDGYVNNYMNAIVSVDQQVGRHVFLAASGNFSSGYRETNYIIVRGLNNVYIDINRNLPTGAANPNFLQPYLESTRDFDTVDNWANNYRASAAFVFDNTRWGDFRLNAEAGRNLLNSSRTKFRYAVKDPAIESREWISNTVTRWRYYLNVPDRPLNDLGSVSVINPVSGTTSQIPTGYVLDSNRPTETVRTRNNFDFYQLALNARLFSGKLNLLAAARQDDWSTNSLFTDFRRDLPATYNGTDRVFKPSGDPATYYGLQYTPKDAAGVATGSRQQAAARPRDGAGNPLPQYAADVFQDDFSPPTLAGTTRTYSYGGVYHLQPWVSVFANYAETWAPPGSNLRIDYTVFVPVTSDGWDAGLRFNFFDGKLQASVTAYGSNQKNLSQSTGTGSAGLAVSLPNAINAIITTNVVGDLSASGNNARGLTLVPSSYVDVASRKTEGWEFETVANLRPGWRLMANLALADATQGDGFADTRAYLAANDTVLRQILADAGVSVSSAGVATVNAGITTANSPDSTNAANSWNQLQGAAANLTPAYQKVARLAEVTANLFTDYTIQSGAWKDFRFGGGINYRGREIIGYRGADTIVNPAAPTTAIDDPSVDALTPVYRPGYSTTTLALGYTRKLLGYPVRFDLTVNNVLDEDKVLYYNTAQRPPGGDVTNPGRVATPNQYYYIPPRSFSLSATVSF